MKRFSAKALGFSSSSVEESPFQIERIGKAVSRVDTHHEGFPARLSQVNGGGCGNTGFPHTTFAAKKQKNSHVTLDKRPGCLRPKIRSKDLNEAIAPVLRLLEFDLT